MRAVSLVLSSSVSAITGDRFDGAKTFLAERAGEVDSTSKRQKWRESGGAGPGTVDKEENEVPLKL